MMAPLLVLAGALHFGILVARSLAPQVLLRTAAGTGSPPRATGAR